MIRLSLRFTFLIILLAGCATTSNIKKEDRVTILLKDGTKIEGHVTDIFNSTIAFEAIDRKKAFDYGEVIQLNLVRGIRMPNGEILSVKEYDAVRKGDEPKASKRKPKRVAKASSTTKLEVQPFQSVADFTGLWNKVDVLTLPGKKADPYVVGFANSDRCVEEALRLRYEVFKGTREPARIARY